MSDSGLRTLWSNMHAHGTTETVFYFNNNAKAINPSRPHFMGASQT